MKKIQTLFAALFAATSLFADTEIDTACIYEIRPCDANGDSIAHPMSTWDEGGQALDASQPLYFNVRLIVPDSNKGPTTTRNEFALNYTGSQWPTGTDQWKQDYERDSMSAPFKIGIYVNGKLDYATFVTLRRTPASGSGDCYDLYDLVFMYVPKPGDLALPIRLARGDGSVVPENYDSESISPSTTYYIGNSNKWSLRYIQSDGTDYKCNLRFIDATATESYTQDSPDLGDEMNSNYSLKGCGFYVKTVDFEDNDESKSEWEAPTYWKSVKKNATATYYLEALAQVITNASPLWVWSDDETALKIAGGTLKENVIVGYKDGGKTPITKDIYMAKVSFQYGSKISDGFKVTGVESNKTANLILSGFDSYAFNTSGLGGVMITNFVTVPVMCTAPAPCSLTLTRRNSSQKTFNVTSNYAERVTQLRLNLSEAFSNEVRITVAPVLKTPGDYLTNQIVRINKENEEDGWVNEDPLVVTYDANEKGDKFIDVYGMGADRNYTVGTGHEIQFKIVDVQPKEAAAFIKTKTDAAAFVYFKPTAPVMLTPEAGEEFTFIGEVTYPLDFTVADNYTDMQDTNTGYKVYWKPRTSETGGDDKQGYSLLKDENGVAQIWRPDADGILCAFSNGVMTTMKPCVVYEDEPDEDNLSYFYLVAQNGEKSAVTRIVVTYKEPAALPTVWPLALNIDSENPNVNEGTNVSVQVEISEAYSKKTTVYAFLKLADTNLYAKLRSTDNLAIEGARSYLSISAKKTLSTKHTIVLDDGTEEGVGLEFDAVLCTTQKFSTNNVVKTYESVDPFFVSVKNVQPEILDLQMNNRYRTTLDEFGNRWMSQPVSMGVPVTFTFPASPAYFTEPSNKDKAAKDAEGESLFKVKMIDEYGNAYTSNGVPTTISFTYTFQSMKDDTSISFQMQDKDMADTTTGGEGGFSQPPFEVHFKVLDQPTISIYGKEGRTVYQEEADYLGSEGAPLTIEFTEATSAKQTLKLTVRNNNPDDPTGTLELYGTTLKTTTTNGVYLLDIPIGKTEISDAIWISRADGTEKSSFTIDIDVVTEGTDPATKTDWKKYYSTKSGTFRIQNCAPHILVDGFDVQGEESRFMNAVSNATEVGASIVKSPIRYRVSDVDFDMTTNIVGNVGTNLEVVWSVGGEEIQPTIYATNKNERLEFYPDFSNFAGKTVVVKVTVTDKDGGVSWAAWYYTVTTTKQLVTYAHGPSGSSGAAQSNRYANKAKGLGKGRTYADATFSDAASWIITWNCGTLKSVLCWAYGYKVGDVDLWSTTRPNTISLDSSGSNTTGDYKKQFDNPYKYDDPSRDSYFYRWIPVDVPEEMEESTAFTSVAPEKGRAGSGSLSMKLATEEDKEGGYSPAKVEAIFAKEWLPSDNCGDINQDGIPDAYVAAYGFDVVDDEGLITGDDLARLDAYNEDADYLPAIGSAIFANFIPALSNTWVTEGRAFTAKLEIRGWDTNLNDAIEKPYVEVANVQPDKVYEDPSTCPTSTLSRLEWDAYVQAGKPDGWSPERPTDPTKLDTDEDGLPDGYEYYIWYKATVGYMDNDVGDAMDQTQGVHKYLTGRRYNPSDPSNPTVIPPSEIAALFDPLTDGFGGSYDTADTDWDGIPDVMEFEIGTNPIDYDTDNDGLPDGYEVARTHTNPLKYATDDVHCDATLNPDNDTMACYVQTMNIVGIRSGNTTAYYCSSGAFSIEDDGEDEAECWRLDVYYTNAKDQLATNTYFTTKAGFSMEASTYECKGKRCLIGDLEKATTWTGRSIEGTNSVLRGTPVRLARGTLFDAVTPAKYRKQKLAAIPSPCYVAYPYKDAYGRGRVVSGATGEVVDNFSAKVYVMHYHVFETRPFDPRTGWFHTQGSVDSAAYTHMDEMLSLVYWYNAGQIASDQLVPTSNRLMTQIWSEFSTNPYDFDTDQDGMPDGWEFYLMAKNGEAAPGSVYSPLFKFQLITDGSVRDNDNDVLEWPQEYSGITSSAQYGWNPTYPQWRNKTMPTNPWNGDTDGDGIVDGDEGGLGNPTKSWEASIIAANFMYNVSGKAGGGLNPLSWDTDLDGLPDPWEVEFHGTYKAGSTVTTTYEYYDDGSKAKTAAVTGTTVTVEQLIGVGATWNMDGMDATVPDARLDYDNDGLANWQEYMVGGMRCWRYDDAWSGWGMHRNSFEDMPENTFSDSNDDPWNIYWHDRLIDYFNDTGNYNPNLANGYFDPGSVYYSCCTNVFDSAKGGFYMFRDGVYHDLKVPVWGDYSRFVYPILIEYLSTGSDNSTYDYTMYPKQYISCDPRNYDTDYDGMDDYYELFHGMNPLLGAPGEVSSHATGVDNPYDVVYDAYSRNYGSSVYTAGAASALNNWWRNSVTNHAPAQIKKKEIGGYDFIAHPWLNGIAGADPDGDNIPNQEESIMPNVQAVSTYHHSDPTPLWTTDSSYEKSLTRRYYKLESPNSEEYTGSLPESLAKSEAQFIWDGVTYYLWNFPGFTLHDTLPPVVTFEYSINQWFAGNGWGWSFEENEGYDSDHDFLSDYEEAQGKTKNASNVLEHDDPLRRQAMYFNGTDAFLQTPVAEGETVPVVAASDEAHQLFLYFTVECWAKPDAEMLENSGQVHALVARSVWADLSGPADEKRMRRNFLIGLKNGRWYASYDGTGTDKKQTIEILNGPVADTDWAHVAATFDGTVFKLFVNGTCQGCEQKTSVQPEHGVEALAVNEAGEMNPHGGTEFFSSSCITLTVGAAPQTLDGIIYDRAWRYRSYLNIEEGNPLGLAGQTTLADYGNWYKGYIDEVRVWDGARSANDILTDCENRTRYTTALAEENRQAVYAQWKLGGRRHDTAEIQLPAQLMYHFAFDHVAGAIQANDVISVPAGFSTAKAVTDAKARWVRPSDWVENSWANSDVKSTVYTDYAWVPWINNTVSHLPRFDLTTLDSVYWSEDYAGATTAVTNGYDSFKFPRSNEVYSRWTQLTYDEPLYYDSHYDRDFSIYNSVGAQTLTKAYSQKTRFNVITGYTDSSTTNEVVVLADENLMKLKFAARDRHIVGDDILPMGGAYPRRISVTEGGMWDNKAGENPKASDAWAQTGKDSDNNGLPDWWEEYARKNYCKDLSPKAALDWNTLVVRKGVQMTALQAYLRDLADGLVKNGKKVYYDEAYADTRDADRDGLPDWWEELYGLDTTVDSADLDPDDDGLSNYQEYILGELYFKDEAAGGFDLANKYGVNAQTCKLNPTMAYSITNQVVSDYFLRYSDAYIGVTNSPAHFYLNEYFGEMATDHDFMEDWWENLYGISYTSMKVYDPRDDKDGDGWSTWAECRSALWSYYYPGNLIDRWTGSDNEKYSPCHPMPIIGVNISYYGTSDIKGYPLVVRTASGQTQRMDAKFVVPAENDGMTQYLGTFVGNSIVHGHLSPGHINADSLAFECASLDADRTYTWNWDWYEERAYDHPDVTAGDLETYVKYATQYPYIEYEGAEPKYETLALTLSSADGLTAGIYDTEFTTQYGTVDCTTGEYEINLTKALGEGNEGTYQFRVTYSSRVGESWPQTVYLSDTKMLQTGNTSVGTGDGYVREGKNTIEAFMDMNANGEYDLGEPYGVVKDVDVGWHKVPVVAIELRDDSNIIPRYQATSGKDESSASTRKFFVRRTAINGTNTVTTKNGTVAVPRPILATAELVMDSRDYLTEEDVLAYGRLDLDWGTLANNLATMGVTNTLVDSIGYEIVEVVDNGNGTTSNAVVKSFTKKYATAQGKAKAVSPFNDAPVYAASPTFTFSGDDDTMTAYRLQIKKAGAADGDLVYDSGCLRLPARVSQTVGQYVYEVTPPIWANTEVFTNNAVMSTGFGDGTNYAWRVQLYNAKFMATDPNKWSDWAQFQMDIGNKNRYPGLATGYGRLSLAVRYYGPTNEYQNVADPEKSPIIYVEAFENADFRGQPLARAKVSRYADDLIDSVTDIYTTNVVLSGVKPGTCFLRAFVDRNGNGQRDLFESWGYVNNVGKGVKAIYNPIAVTVTSSTADWNLSENAQYTLYIEDTDVDKNEVPDCTQGEDDFAKLSDSDETQLDSDGDGLKDYEEKFYGTDPNDPDTDGDGLNDYEEVVTYGTTATNADTDYDGMDDYWEVVNGTDPTNDDAEQAIDGDVMAYAVVGVDLVTYDADGDGTVETYAKRYAVVPKGETNRLYRTFSVNGKTYIGAPTAWRPEIGEMGTKTATAVLMHSAVYDWYGYDTTTARITHDGTNAVMGANTKAFTYGDKYRTDTYYLPQFGIEYHPVNPNATDSNNNQIDDGWELYVALAQVAKIKSFPVSNEEQIRHAWEHNYDPYDELAVFKLLLAADPETALDMVPFTNEEAFRYGFADAGSNYWQYAASDDVMAIAENVAMRVANKEGTLYAIRLDGTQNGEVSETNRLWTTFQLYGGQLVLGKPTDLTVADVNQVEGWLISTNVTIVHSGVYDWYGFDSTTARAVSNAVNTAAFTRAWKWNTNKAYLPEFDLTTMPLNLDAIDSNANTIDDGWELYVGFADPAPVKTFPVSNQDEMLCASGHNIGGVVFDPYSTLVYDTDDAGNEIAIDNKDAFDYRLFDFTGSAPFSLDTTSDYDYDGLSNYQEYKALTDLGLVLDVEDWMTDGTTPDYFRVGPLSTKYAGEFYNGAEWIDATMRSDLGMDDLLRAGTRDWNSSGWDNWSVGKLIDRDGYEAVYDVAYTDIVDTAVSALLNSLNKDKNVIAVKMDQVSSNSWRYAIYTPKDNDLDSPEVDLTIKYAGNESKTVIVEAWQVNSAYPEKGEQCVAKWSLDCEFKAGVEQGYVDSSNITEGRLGQGPTRFVAYLDNEKAVCDETTVNVGYEGVAIAFNLGTHNTALPVIELDGSNVVQSVAIVRTKVNGVELEKPRGVYVNYFPNNMARQRLYPSDFVRKNFIGIDKTLAKDYAEDNEIERVYSVEYAVIDGKDRPYTSDNWSTNTLTTFTVNYSETRDKATINAIADALASNATLSFNVPTNTANTKFWLKVNGKVFGDSAGFVLPYTADGTVTIAFADYATIDNLAVGAQNTFQVALGNDKYGYPTESDWSAEATQYIGKDAVRHAGFTVTVKHPTANVATDFKTGKMVVAAYEGADLAEPVAWRAVDDFTGGTIALDGLLEGKSYYLAAWYVRDEEDGRGEDYLKYRQPYDTWGYFSSLGTNSTCFAALAVKATEKNTKPATAVTVWLQDTDYNDNVILDRLEAMTAIYSAENAIPVADLSETDFDGDSIPDAIDDDPFTPGWDDDEDPYWVDGDVMAYAEVPMYLLKLSDGTEVLAKPNGSIAVGQAASAYDVWSTYDYAGGYGRGAQLTADDLSDLTIAEISEVDAILVHAQVYDEFGFNSKTAVAVDDAVNTKAFTQMDKYLVGRYLDAIGSTVASDSSDLAEANRADYDEDGVPDGWELYVMFGPNGVTDDGTVISPWDPSDAQEVSPGDADLPADVQLRLIDEFDTRADGPHTTDPWLSDTDGDNVIDYYYHTYMLWDAGADTDGDGLSNYTEYLISKVFKFADLDPNNAKTDGSCVDYFRKKGELYFGEMFTDHDQVTDTWEQNYMDKVGTSSDLYANRYIYDPSADWDGDGWSNYAEFKAGTNPEVVTSPGAGYTLPEYPIPAIAASVVYNGKPGQVLSGAIIFQAWSQKTDSDMTGSPDAVWRASSDAVMTNVTKYIGVNPGEQRSYYLGTGTVRPGTLGLEFRDMAYERATVFGGQVVTNSAAESGYAYWHTIVQDNGYGDLYTAASNMVRVVVGSIDYATGLMTIDFGNAALQGTAFEYSTDGDSGSASTVTSSHTYSNMDALDLSRCYVRISWLPEKIDTTGNATYYLSDSSTELVSKGHVREGLNKFVVFCDTDDDGAYTPGEPFGFVRDVDIGWQGGSFTVQLTETSPIFARIDLLADEGKESDRQVWQDNNSTVINVGDEETDEASTLRKKMGIVIDDDLDLTAQRLIRVRVMRSLVNGSTKLGVDNKGYDVGVKRVVLDKYLDLGTRSYLHEGDFLTDGAYDLDWELFQDEVVKKNAYQDVEHTTTAIFQDPTNVTYVILLGEGDVMNSVSNTAFRCVVNRVFDCAGSRLATDEGGTPAAATVIRPVIDPTTPQDIIYGARPTFRFAMRDKAGNNYNSYTAFKLRINGVETDLKTLPPCDANGWYTWTLDEALGARLPASGNYTWQVALYNAKFQDGKYRNLVKTWNADTRTFATTWTGYITEWSEEGTFTIDLNNQQDMNDHGYSSIAATVKYAGPSAVLAKGAVFVQAFTTADFAGAPMGQCYATTDLADTSRIVANAVVKGLPETGTYYLRAFIDMNGNRVKDDFESWGAASEPVTLSTAVVTRPTVGIWIEDADTDGDWIPDAYEYATQNGDLTVLKGEIIEDDKIRFSTTSYSGTAGISTGLEGASLTVFQNSSIVNTLLGNELGSTVSISDIRAAVEKKVVNPTSVKITALTLAADGKTVILSVEAEVSDTIAGEILGQLYNITSGDSATVTVHVYKKNTLAEADWTEVGTGYTATVGRTASEVVVPISGVDMKSGFYKVEVVQ